MFPKLQTGLYKRQTKIRFIAFIFLICFILLSILSDIFIATRANHVHNHNGVASSCTICVQVQLAENILKQMGMAFYRLLLILSTPFAIIALIRDIASNIISLTPVKLKIRMNN